MSRYVSFVLAALAVVFFAAVSSACPVGAVCAVPQPIVAPVYAPPIVQAVAVPVYQQAVVQRVVQPVYAQAFAAPIQKQVIVQRNVAPLRRFRSRSVQRVRVRGAASAQIVAPVVAY